MGEGGKGVTHPFRFIKAFFSSDAGEKEAMNF